MVKRIGLRTQDVVKARKIYGENEFSKPKERSVFLDIVHVLKEPLMLILMLAGGLSFLVGEYEDGLGIFIAVLLGILIGRLTEGRSKKAAEALSKSLDDIRVKVVRDGVKIQVLKKDLVPGDIVHLEAGDMIPADGIVLESRQLAAREDMLTGESDQVEKKAGLVVFGGTLVGDGSGVMEVTAIGDATEMGQIARDLDQEEVMTPLQIKLGKLGGKISTVSSSIAFMLFGYMVLQILRASQLRFDWTSWEGFLTSVRQMDVVFPSVKTAFIVCVGLIVAAVPEGLPTMVNITLALTMGRMSKVNVLIRKKEACETIGSVSVICSDKTGTLTENKMKVRKVFLDGQWVNIGDLNQHPMFVNNCILNATGDVDFTGEEPLYMGNPTECALIAATEMTQYQQMRDRAQRVRTVPFSSENKYMLSVIKSDLQYVIYAKGAPEVVLAQCDSEWVKGRRIALNPHRSMQLMRLMNQRQSEGMRVLAFAFKETPSKQETMRDDWTGRLVFHGFVAINDPLREGVLEAIETTRNAHIETKILTGDHYFTAEAIGREIGIVQDGMRVVEASYIEGLTDEQLRREITSIAVVTRSMPATKLRIVSALQANGEVVAVTGDGINDAPALTKADVGIAMGIAGTEVSKGAADIILTDDNFKTIVEAIKWGRGIYNNFQRYIQFTLTVNVIAFSIMILSQMLGMTLPFTTIHLLWINIIMDGPPALALGMEPIRNSVMNRKPIQKKHGIIHPFMLATIGLNSLFISIVLFLQMRFNFLGADLTNVTAHGSEFRTVMFSLFASLAIFNALNCREFGITSVKENFFKNKAALAMLAGTLLLQIVATQFASGFFDAVPLSLQMWARIVATGSSVVMFSELLKLIIRRINGKRKGKKHTPFLKLKRRMASFS
ncbi:MAG: calcium-translocating P-type ATPase, PMCA-type [Defluviitaleaceae bacterium]|nr:calcium-translocating P-type ATPase, PMCA-type [Defluviitaleaceae bacterium]